MSFYFPNSILAITIEYLTNLNVKGDFSRQFANLTLAVHPLLTLTPAEIGTFSIHLWPATLLFHVLHLYVVCQSWGPIHIHTPIMFARALLDAMAPCEGMEWLYSLDGYMSLPLD